MSKNVLIENNVIEAPTDNGGGSGGANALTLRYDNVQGNCLRNWVLRNNTIPGSVALSSDTASAGGCGVNFNVIGNILGSFTESRGTPISCGTGVLSNPIVFRNNVFANMSCHTSDVNLHNGAYGFASVAAHDYHLAAGSSAIDLVPGAAYSVPAAFTGVQPPGGETPNAVLPTDYEGDARFRGAAYDAGADER